MQSSSPISGLGAKLSSSHGQCEFIRRVWACKSFERTSIYRFPPCKERYVLDKSLDNPKVTVKGSIRWQNWIDIRLSFSSRVPTSLRGAFQRRSSFPDIPACEAGLRFITRFSSVTEFLLCRLEDLTSQFSEGNVQIFMNKKCKVSTMPIKFLYTMYKCVIYYCIN